METHRCAAHPAEAGLLLSLCPPMAPSPDVGRWERKHDASKGHANCLTGTLRQPGRRYQYSCSSGIGSLGLTTTEPLLPAPPEGVRLDPPSPWPCASVAALDTLCADVALLPGGGCG